MALVPERCSTCTFWLFGWDKDELDNPLPPAEACGECRRFPPTITSEVPAEHPITTAHTWCGGYKGFTL